MPDLSKVTDVRDREWNAFCNTSDGEIAKRTCSEITNDASNPVPVSVQFEGVGEAGFTCNNLSVTEDTITSLVLESNVSTLEIYSRNDGVIEWNLNDATLTCYNTIPCGCEYSKSDLRLSGMTLYLRSDRDDTIEIRQWTST